MSGQPGGDGGSSTSRQPSFRSSFSGRLGGAAPALDPGLRALLSAPGFQRAGPSAAAAGFALPPAARALSGDPEAMMRLLSSRRR